MNKSIRSVRYRAALVGFLGSPVLLVALGFAALADTQAAMPMSATYICRPALVGESVSATMAKSSTALVCRALAVEARMPDGSMKTIGSVSVKADQGPDFSHALTPQQFNDAYTSWLVRTFHIDHSP